MKKVWEEHSRERGHYWQKAEVQSARVPLGNVGASLCLDHRRRQVMRGNWIDKQDPAHKQLPGQSLDLSQRHLGTMELNYANDTLRCAF